ncbi:hypothetical protein [Phreatobacter stygius]|uniref:hypothetical protein n=1 Tax=Phreatobacter stygius TaxID=1940610 RepID=UPI001B8B3988|nr:hypothetical protein [Phreatobacter stygius]
MKPVGEIRTAHIFDMVIDLHPRLNIGAGQFGQRVLFGAAGGSFEGPTRSPEPSTAACAGRA